MSGLNDNIYVPRVIYQYLYNLGSSYLPCRQIKTGSKTTKGGRSCVWPYFPCMKFYFLNYEVPKGVFCTGR